MRGAAAAAAAAEAAAAEAAAAEAAAAAQLVEALRYKPEGPRFDSRWCHWNFSLT